MKEKFMNFYSTFNMDDLIDYVLGLDFIEILTNPIVVAPIIVLIGLSIYRRNWGFTIKKTLTYTFFFGYIFLCVVVVKNSDISEASTFLLFLSVFFLVVGTWVYKYLILS